MHLFKAICLIGLAGVVSALNINTPANVVYGANQQLSWSGGTGPYTVSIVPGNDPNGAALEALDQTTSTSQNWCVDIASLTSVALNLRDSTGETAQSAPFTINAGLDCPDACFC